MTYADACEARVILGLALTGALSLAAFLVVERRAAEPILPLGIFRSRNFSVITLIGFLVGFAAAWFVEEVPLRAAGPPAADRQEGAEPRDAQPAPVEA